MYRGIYKKYLTLDGFKDFEEVEIQFNDKYYLDKNIWNILPKDKSSNILDIGCGFGMYMKHMKSLGFDNIKGVEIGEEQNQFLRGKGFDVLQVDIFDYIKATDLCGAVFNGCDVLEHFTKREIMALLPLMKNILSEKGVLIIRVPNGEAMFNGSIMYGDFTHEVFFTTRSIKQIFNMFDFSSVNVLPVYPVKHGVKSIIRYYGYKFYELIYKIGIIFECGTAKNYNSTRNILGIIKK